MKKNLLILSLFLSMRSACGAENISSEDGYAIVVGIVGAVTTTASWICWYFHQKMLKEDFSRKESESFHTINNLRIALDFPLSPNPRIRVIEPSIEEGLPVLQQRGSLLSRVPADLFLDDDEVVMTDFRALSLQSNQEDLPSYRSASSLPAYESPIPSINDVFPEERISDHFHVIRALVGSLNPSPMLVENRFEGLEEQV